jgi:hypothetical protein
VRAPPIGAVTADRVVVAGMRSDYCIEATSVTTARAGNS